MSTNIGVENMLKQAKHGRQWESDLGWLTEEGYQQEGISITKNIESSNLESYGVKRNLMQKGYHLEMPLFKESLNRDNAEWKSFAESWDRLEVDEYMADGGKYRQRRYMTMLWDSASDQGALKMPYMPLFRASTYNSFAGGGVRRYFAPIEDSLFENKYFIQCIEYALKTFSQIELKKGRYKQEWFIDVDQYRITADENTHGEPTPEGIHSDGTNYFLLMLVDRQNVVGGESSIYTAEEELVTRVTLANPADMMLIDDERMMHGVSSVMPLNDQAAHRDIFHISCTNIYRPGSVERRFGLSTEQANTMLKR